MSSAAPSPVRVVILGNDAMLAARPAQPLQLVRACQRVGFDLVAPVSWGEELLAEHVADEVRRRGDRAAIVAHCPLVADAMRVEEQRRVPCVTAVSPPRATARYVRAALAGLTVRVTYVGACPGARLGGEIDESVAPEDFLGRLLDWGIVLDEQAAHLEGQLPPERARHASLPGGVPDAAWLAATVGAELCEAAPATIGAIASADAPDPLVLDLEAACGCVCARDRFTHSRLDPPRAQAPVVRAARALDLSDPDLERALRVPAVAEREAERLPAVRADVPAPHAASGAGGHGPTVVFERTGEPARRRAEAPNDLTISIEPWVRAPCRGSADAKGPAGGGPRRDILPRGQAEHDVPRAATIEPGGSMPQPAPARGGRGSGSAHPPGVRPRSLSPVPPVISPALRSVMDLLAAQDRDARRRTLRRRGIVAGTALLVALAAFALSPRAQRPHAEIVVPVGTSAGAAPSRALEVSGGQNRSSPSGGLEPVRDSLIRGAARAAVGGSGAAPPTLPEHP